MNWSKVGRIIRREYVESVRKRSFLFGLVATPLIMLSMIFLPLLAGDALLDETLQIGVLDETGELGARLEASLEEETDGFRPQLLLFGPEDVPSPERLDADVEEGLITGWLRIPADFEESRALEYRAETITNVTTLELLSSRFDRIVVEKRIEELGLGGEAAAELLASTEIRTFRIGRDDGEEADFTSVYLHAVLLVMILFLALVPTGQILMRSVIEEKGNRVIEVLLSSVTPKELMTGKIVGLGAVGLTLLAVWSACGFLFALRTGSGFPIRAEEAGIFVLYFFPGYFLYGALLGSIGSICNSERDAQPFQIPINLMLVFPVMIGLAIAQNPDHLFARTMSFVPFFTPSLMLFRYTIKAPPAWEIAATWTVLVAGTIAMFWTASRVFRVGILLYGKRPTLPEIGHWLRSS